MEKPFHAPKKSINTFANDYQERSQKNQMSSAVRSEVTLRGQSFEKVSSCISIIHISCFFFDPKTYTRLRASIHYNLIVVKGQLISNANCQAMNSSKKRMNEFVFISIRCVFVCILEEIEDSKKALSDH